MYIVMCFSDCRRGVDWAIGFIDTLYIQLILNKHYSAVADLQFTVTRTHTH
jgi:Na+(H+)/acetate symporter ActP